MFQQHRNRIVLCVTVLVAAMFHAGTACALTVGTVSVDSPANPAQVPLYGKIELNVPLTTTSTKPYEAAPAQGGVDLSAVFTAPNAATTTIKGFYNGSAWRIRFAPSQTGVWQAAVSVTDSTGTVNAAGISFTCLASGSPGFAQINGKYIQFTNGTAFYAVGHNTGWQQDVEQPAAADMAAQGENLLSFWMAAPWGLPTDSWWMRRTPIENSVGGLGNYDQNACAYMDSVVANAEAAGIYLLPSIWAHDQLCDGTVPSGWPASWSNNAYKNICTATNFYQTTSGSADTNQWRLQKNYYRYILARWGYSRAIVGWVGVVEIDGTTGMVNNATQANAWCAALRTYFAANDKYRLNTASAYPLLVSKVDAPTFDGGMNMRATDSYTSKNSNVAVAATLASETATMRSSGKPGLFTEFGGDTLSGASQPAHLHNGIWAATAAGTATTPLLWCDGGNYPMLTADMRTHLRILGQFVAGLDYPINNSLTAAAPTVPTGFKAWSQQLTNRGFVWVQNTTGSSLGGQTLTVSGLTAGSYSVAWYDVWSSGNAPFATTPTATVSGTTLAVALPALARADVACRFFLNTGAPGISAISASPNPVISTTTQLAVTASDDGGEPALNYTWATIGTPPAPVSFSANGTNAAKYSLATFTTAGSYTFQVTVKDLGGRTATQTVGVTVNAVPTTGLSVNPPSAIVGISGSMQFTASAQDQFGHALTVQASWNVNGGGSIGASGMFVAGSVGGGPFTVTATASGLSGTADLGVIDSPPSVNMTNPLNGAVFGSGSTITLTANAADDGTITYVAFYANGALLGAATSMPYSFAWVNAPIGPFALIAIATDNAGHATQSAAVNIVVDALPAVSVSAPLNNSIFNNGTVVALSADASDADGTVVKVEYFAGSTLIGTSTSAPYAVAWNSPAPGTYSITAKATDDLGLSMVSSPVAISIDAPPTVNITSPAGGALFNVGSTVTITANSADDFGVASVAFYANGVLLGTAALAPYSIDLPNVPSGPCILTAVATDTAGQTALSAAVTILADAAPTVSISSPASNSIFATGSNLALSAAAADTDGTVAKVDFYAGATLVGTATQAPFGITWNSPAPGTYSLTAKATDDLGAATVSTPVIVIINAPPTASLTAPANNSVFTTGTNVALSASAADADGSVTKVEFFAGSVLVGTTTSAPYSVTWSNPAKGTYALTAKATDNQGAATVSAAASVIINAPPTCTITSPANNASITRGATVTLKATAADSDGTIASVAFIDNGVTINTDTTSAYQYSYVPAKGTHVLTAVATDNRGATTTSTAVTITVK